MSVAGNVALLLVLRSMAGFGPGLASSVHVRHDRTASAWGEPTVRGDLDASLVRATSTPIVAKGDGGRWSDLHTEDFGLFVTRLRAAGFPPRVVHAIITSMVQERFLAQREELLGDAAEVSFRKTSPDALIDPKKMAALNKLVRERDALVKQLLGSDAAFGDELWEVYARRRFGVLTPEKRNRLQQIIDDYEDIRAELGMSDGPLNGADRKKLVALEKEFRSDIAQVLTTQELEEYDLRNSSTASQLRARLDAFNASEEEYRAIFQVTRGTEERMASIPASLSAEQLKARREAEQQLQSQLRERLDPERYADYLQATNLNYSMINQLVTRFDRPISAAREVIAVERDILGRANAIRADESISSHQKETQLSVLAQEASARLASALTERGLEAYKQRGGAWLSALYPAGVH